jgi:hypothetical protein
VFYNMDDRNVVFLQIWKFTYACFVGFWVDFMDQGFDDQSFVFTFSALEFLDPVCNDFNESIAVECSFDMLCILVWSASNSSFSFCFSSFRMLSWSSRFWEVIESNSLSHPIITFDCLSHWYQLGGVLTSSDFWFHIILNARHRFHWMINRVLINRVLWDCSILGYFWVLSLPLHRSHFLIYGVFFVRFFHTWLLLIFDKLSVVRLFHTWLLLIVC